jgi:hypothetical protein
MSKPVEARGPIPLYQVLVEELNHQYPDFPLTVADVAAQRPAYEAVYDAEHLHVPPEVFASPEFQEERRKAVDDRLVREFYSQFYAKRRERGSDERIDRSALCFSGGGIRSATFGLGIVQGIAHLGLLGKFDYLSTVSGGGYLGSWLSAWIERDGLPAVEKELQAPPRFPLSPEPQPVSHLRSYSRYISPHWGLLSADTWTLVAIYFRNLFLNWTVLLPLLASFFMIPRISVYLLRQQRLPEWAHPWIFGLGLASGVLAIAYIGINRPSLAGKAGLLPFPEKLRSQGWFLVLCLLPLVLMAIAVCLFWAWNPIPLERLRFDFLGWKLTPVQGFVLYGLALHAGAYLVGRFFVPLGWREILGVVVTGGFGGWLTWLAASRLFPRVLTPEETERYVCASAPLLLFLFLAAATLFVGLASKYTSDEDREWLARAGAWILIAILLRSATSLIVIYGPVFWHWAGVKALTAVGGISGLVTLLLGRSAKTGASESKKGQSLPASAQATNVAMAIAAPLFALSIIVGLAFLTTRVIQVVAPHLPGITAVDWPLDFNPDDPYGHLVALYYTPGRVILFVLALFLAVGVGMGFRIDINRFSLHGAYRDRLIRAYLGASRNHDERHPNPFTGFDEADNLELCQLRVRRPLHVINAALNLVAGQKLAWQDRKAESFTFSALHSGSYCLGYRSSDCYGRHRETDKAVSLGTAFAISGAAASPNMGYHSSPAVTFLLALWNVRLGWWMGNPGPKGEKTYDQSGPRFAPRPLFAEAFGRTSDEHPYVYLSDGGHFENLGIYEMVLRRCRYIVVADAAADAKFEYEDLGNAIGKIRIDLGIPIEFDRLPMRAQDDMGKKIYEPIAKKPEFPYCAVGRIRYSCVDAPEAVDEDREEIDGWLIYIKPALNGTEPPDVFNYAKLHPTFPHETTANQLYTEAEFESYRALARHALGEMTRGLPEPTLDELFRAVESYAAK